MEGETQAPSLPALVRACMSELSSKTAADPYLCDVAARFPSHRFLAASTQGVYRRQVAFLARLLEARNRRPREEIGVLDWGCGKGHISYLLRKAGFTVTSCDRLADSGDSAFGQPTPILRENGIDVVPLADPVALPFPDACFDCATSFGVLEHVPAELDSLREIRRILKAGGLFYVTFLPYRLSWTQALDRWRGSSYHDRLYTGAGVQRIAALADFAVRSVSHAQLFPKNSTPYSLGSALEPLDRALCRFTPLKYLATNLEVVMEAV